MTGNILLGLGVQQGRLLAQIAETSDKLPPPTRAAVMMTLLGILLLGMMFVVFVLVGGHWIRRLGSHRRGPAVPPDVMPGSSPKNSTPTIPPKLPNTKLNEGDTMIPDDTQF